MLASITPLGERGRNNRFARTATAYVIGSTLGGLAIGALAGALGWLAAPSSRTAAVFVVAVSLAAAAADLSLGGLRLPTVHRQVNEDWLTAYRGWVYGLGFGFQLGLGVVTIVTTAAVYAALADAVLTGSVWGGLAIGATFGLVRGLAVFAGARIVRLDQLTRLHRRFAALARPASLATVGVEILVAGAAAAAIVATMGTP